MSIEDQNIISSSFKLLSLLLNTDEQAALKISLLKELNVSDADAKTLLLWQPKGNDLDGLQQLKKAIELLRTPNAARHWRQSNDTIKQVLQASSPTIQVLNKIMYTSLMVLCAERLKSLVSSPPSHKSHSPHSPHNRTKAQSKASTKKSVIELPNNPNNIWLAIGDETGNWDYETSTRNKLGLSIVFARLSDWQPVFSEMLKGRSIQAIMSSPLQQLPEFANKSNFHHSIDAMKLGKPSPELYQELNGNLNWLANHTHLSTMGLYTKNASQIWDHLDSSKDASSALGQCYGLLMASIMPFIEPSDCLLLGFDRRSESENNLAAQRAGQQLKTNINGRVLMDERTFHASLRNQFSQSLEKWKDKSFINRFDALSSQQLFKTYQLEKYGLPTAHDKAWPGLSDLGATILNQLHLGDSTFITQYEISDNVYFFNLKEVL